MAQDYTATIAGTDFANLILKTTIPNNFEAVRTLFSGTSAPSSPSAGQLWYDTTNGLVKQYTGAAWEILGPSRTLTNRLDVTERFGSLSATAQVAFFTARNAGTVLGVGLTSGTTTSGSVAATTEWQWGLRNVTQAVELFSGTVGTGTVLGGVGGGEITLETAYFLAADQNQAFAASDVLRFTATKVGAPTSPLADLVLQLDGYYRGT